MGVGDQNPFVLENSFSLINFFFCLFLEFYLGSVVLSACSRLLYIQSTVILVNPHHGCIFVLFFGFGWEKWVLALSLCPRDCVAGSVSSGKVEINFIIFDSDFVFPCSITSHIHKLLYHHVKRKVTPTNHSWTFD